MERSTQGYEYRGNEGGSFLERLGQRRVSTTVEELCEREGCKIEELPSLVASKAQNIVYYCEENYRIVGSEINPQIDFLYQCYQATRDLPEDSGLSEFATSLESFDTFISNYAEGMSSGACGNLMSRIDRYIKKEAHTSRLIYEDLGKTHLGYLSKVEWIPLPYSFSVLEDYVERGVVEEVINLQKAGYESPDLYHATGSAALDGIAEHNAILAANKAVKLGGEIVKTGEYSIKPSYDNFRIEDGEREYGIYNLIYASDRPIIAYAIARWFDEFHVIFGLSKDKIAEYQKEHGGEIGGVVGVDFTIGSKVPLELVDVIYGEYISLDKLKEWQEKNAPQARVVSIEAGQLLRDRPEENWESLLRQEPIVI